LLSQKGITIVISIHTIMFTLRICRLFTSRVLHSVHNTIHVKLLNNYTKNLCAVRAWLSKISLCEIIVHMTWYPKSSTLFDAIEFDTCQNAITDQEGHVNWNYYLLFLSIKVLVTVIYWSLVAHYYNYSTVINGLIVTSKCCTLVRDLSV